MKQGEGACACYWVEPTDRYRRWLRRFTFSNKKPCTDGGSHNASSRLDTVRRKKQPASGDRWSHDDERWPTRCEKCGYEFEAEDEWQLNVNTIFEVTATVDESYIPVGARVVLGTDPRLNDEYAKPGALWDADWMPDGYRGPDGIALIARCPNGLDWRVDGEATGGGRWTRQGDPRNPSTLSVSPSIAIGGAENPNYYHGFLGSSGAQPGHFTGHLG